MSEWGQLFTADTVQPSITARDIQWLFYTLLVWGETASFGGDIRGLGAVPPAGPGAEPLVRGSGGEAPRS